MRRIGLLCVLFALGVCAPAAAAEWQITPMLGLTFGGSTTLQDPEVGTEHVHTNIGLAGTFLSNGLFGAEAIVNLTPGFFEAPTGSAIVSSRTGVLMGNVVLTAPRRWTEYGLRPFVSGGFGLMHASERGSPILGVSLIDVKTNLPAFNIGGGAVGFLSPSVGVRFDFRYYATLHGTELEPGAAFGAAHLRYMHLSAGLVLRLR
jgi:hypothetical protein